MSLAHVILVSLTTCPKSGYDLAKEFDGSVGFFWRATHQQIYRELSRLEEQNWVNAQPIPQEGRPDKKLYSLTEQGTQALQSWILQPSELSPVKEEILVKLYAGFLVPIEPLIAELKRHHQAHQERLLTYQEIERQYFANPATLSPEGRFRYLTLRRGLRYQQDWVGWCEEAIALLETPVLTLK